MDTKAILWACLILPWLTVFFMKKKALKHFLPAALFTAFSSGIIIHLGYALGFWYFREENAPLMAYGVLAVTLIWVLRFTYRRFWLYFFVNAILDLGFAFLIFPLLDRIGIVGVGTWSTIIVYIINLLQAVLIYGYYKWQEQ